MSSTTRVLFTDASGNRKIGPIPASITTRNTCPPTCGVFDACYAKFHFLAKHWRRAETEGVIWGEFCRWVAGLPAGIIWRHNEAGDLPGEGNTIDVPALRELVEANRGRRGFTYTAKPVRGGSTLAVANRQAIADANAHGFIVNLSAVGLRDADAKVELGIGPVTVVLSHDVVGDRLTTPAGRTVTVCPNQRDPRIQCWFCGLCTRGDRVEIIGFPAHGAGRLRIARGWQD